MRPRTRRSTALLRLLVVSSVMGLLAAGIVLPVVGGAGLLARATTDSFTDLPSELQVPPLPQRSRVLDADGHVIAVFFTQDRVSVPLSHVAPVMQRALVAIEDYRFFQHGAVDVKGTLRAAATDVGSGGSVQGGSTLTQQYVKNVLATEADTAAGKQAATARSLARKLREARYAIALEKKLTKAQILERYLNIVYFGEGAYGVESAARRYFGVHASKLTLPQAALLAGLVQSPSAYDPVHDKAAAKLRRDTVLGRMRDVGAASPSAVAAALASPVALHVEAPEDGCQTSWTPFFCSAVRAEIDVDAALGDTRQARERALFTGGLTIKTTLDPTAERAAQHAVSRVVPVGSRVAAAIAMVQPGSGAVRAIAEDRPYGSDVKKHETRINLATGGQSGFQAGSTFKAFTLAAAIDKKLPLDTTFDAPPKVDLDGFTDCQGNPLHSWSPHNAEANEGGRFGLAKATWESVNTYFAQLERKVGVCRPWQLAKAAGITEISTGKPPAQVPAFTLGVDDTSPLQVAGAYAMFAARGMYCRPYFVGQILDHAGKAVSTTKPSCHRVLSQSVSDTVTSVLRGVVDGPDPYRTGASASIGRPAAGKTGTTDGFSAAWFSGYTPQIAASVWVGDPRGATHPLTNVTVAGRFYHHVYGADLPAAAWHSAMLGALKDVPAVNFAGAGGSVASDTVNAPAPPAARRPPHAPTKPPVKPSPKAPPPKKKKHGH